MYLQSFLKLGGWWGAGDGICQEVTESEGIPGRLNEHTKGKKPRWVAGGSLWTKEVRQARRAEYCTLEFITLEVIESLWKSETGGVKYLGIWSKMTKSGSSVADNSKAKQGLPPQGSD